MYSEHLLISEKKGGLKSTSSASGGKRRANKIQKKTDGSKNKDQT